MRIAFPVIFIRNGQEFAGIVASSSLRKDQIPLEDLNSPLTREQRFNELRCSIAFWDTVIQGWRQANNVPYLPIDQEIPAIGDFYSEVGAPDPHERVVLKQAQAEHAAKMEEGRRAFAALSPEEQARVRAENGAANQASSVAGTRAPITGHDDNTDAAAAAIDYARSPDPVDPEPLATSAELATEAAIDDDLDAGVGSLETDGGVAHG